MKILLFSILSAIAQTSGAQVNIICPGLTDSSLNYLYIGVDNRIELVDIKIPAENLVISISGGGGTLTKVATYKYIVRVSTVSDKAIITISNKTKLILKEEFKVRVIGEPKYNWEHGTTINRDSLLKHPFLSLTIPDCHLKLHFEIVSYVATIDDADSIVEFAINGCNFSPEFINHLKTKKNGKLLTFDNIRVKAPDGRSFRSPSFALYFD